LIFRPHFLQLIEKTFLLKLYKGIQILKIPHFTPLLRVLQIFGRIVLAFFNTLTILALASRAFAFYYALQCIVGIKVSKNSLEKLAIPLVAAVLIFIEVFSVPAG
jgi:hypothetical protein